MNWLVIMNAQPGSATQACTPVRSAWTRKPVTDAHEPCGKRTTGDARAPYEAVTSAAAELVTCSLLLVKTLH